MWWWGRSSWRRRGGGGTRRRGRQRSCRCGGWWHNGTDRAVGELVAGHLDEQGMELTACWIQVRLVFPSQERVAGMEASAAIYIAKEVGSQPFII